MKYLILVCCALLPAWLFGQRFDMATIPLKDLSPFKPTGKNWSIVGDVSAGLDKQYDMKATAGTGVLVNLPDKENNSNLTFNLEHGDLDLDIEVMMPLKSNSGIYLQGRYEVQLLDSWGKLNPYFGDMGGLYERWDDDRPNGQKGYEGTAPLLNVARAPGLWQKLHIEFQAPRFDAKGKKTANARIIKVVLNGFTIQENVVLTGPTRPHKASDEVALGPLFIQGDHGPVAFRNIRYREFSGKTVALRDLRYRTVNGPYGLVPQFDTITRPSKTGPANAISWDVAESTNEIAVQFIGKLDIPKAGKYWFSLYSLGNSSLKVNGQKLVDQGWWTRAKSMDLPAGTVDLEVGYAKVDSWIEPVLSLTVEGVDFRPVSLHSPNSAAQKQPVNPILKQVGSQPEFVRCFFDIPKSVGSGTQRIVHSIAVGHPKKANYAYDMDNGAVFQIWRGNFLNATPMWNDRGDGHADPVGSVITLGSMPPVVQSLEVDTLPSNADFRTLGYKIDANGLPGFMYKIYGLSVEDRIEVEENGKWLSRELQFSGTPTTPVQFKVVSGKNIVQQSSGLWSINDKEYYIKSGAALELKTTAAGIQTLVAPAKGTLQYSIIW
jgi:Domain of Unknown Function (DUF1080)